MDTEKQIFLPFSSAKQNKNNYHLYSSRFYCYDTPWTRKLTEGGLISGLQSQRDKSSETAESSHLQPQAGSRERAHWDWLEVLKLQSSDPCTQLHTFSSKATAPNPIQTAPPTGDQASNNWAYAGHSHPSHHSSNYSKDILLTGMLSLSILFVQCLLRVPGRGRSPHPT